MAKVSIDLNRAIELDKERRRIARSPRFAELDTAFMRALEAGNSELQQEVTTIKQELRDVTKDHHYANCTCLDDITCCWPENTLGPCPYHQHNHD